MAVEAAPPAAHAAFSFAGRIQPTELSWAYRVGLLVVAVAMLLLPLIYLGVIVLAAAGVWWHLTAHEWWMHGGSTGIQWRATAYVAPAVAGVVVTFFMIKPAFARRPALPDPLTVTASQHPALFAFITDICRHVRAPVPRLVQVDCQVNASAGFAPGLRSVFQRDLVLTIGLPLVRALSVRELAGVLAHEFGHFAQGSGLTLTMLVRGINRWFSRVVYERDNWDARLDQWSQKRGRLSLLIMPSRAAVWLSRRILTLLMVGGHAISCFMTRQMEYDADSYEVKIAGSDAFARTMRRLDELNQATAQSGPHIRSELAKRRLPADLPLFLVTWVRWRAAPATVPDERARKSASLFDTHPWDDDRLAAAARAGDRGILVGGNDAATGLFSNFDWLSRHATRHHYEERGLLDAVSLVDAVDSVQASVETP